MEGEDSNLHRLVQSQLSCRLEDPPAVITRLSRLDSNQQDLINNQA